jgi:hypothetical protein
MGSNQLLERDDLATRAERADDDDVSDAVQGV